MKKTKLLIPALGIMCLSVAASVTGTVAWFAANNVVTAKGMAVKSITPESLVISETLPDATTKGVTVEFTKPTNGSDKAVPELNPSTHDGNFSTCLKHLTATDKIDPATGLCWVTEDESDPHYGMEISDDDYANAERGTHFVDYTVYIASAGPEIKAEAGKKRVLTAEIRNATTYTASTHKAVSVDFYVQKSASDPAKEDYKDTLNCAGIKISDPTVTDYRVVNLFEATAATPIPTRTVVADNALKITMRVYLDGALKENDSKAFVTNNDVDVSDVQLVIDFKLGNEVNA